MSEITKAFADQINAAAEAMRAVTPHAWEALRARAIVDAVLWGVVFALAALAATIVSARLAQAAWREDSEYAGAACAFGALAFLFAAASAANFADLFSVDYCAAKLALDAIQRLK